MFIGARWLGFNNAKAHWMLLCRNRVLVCSIPLLIFSSGCRAQPECDSIETRNSVLRFISDDRNNPLLDYAAKNSAAGKEGLRPLYQLGQRMVTMSTSEDKRTLKCSGPLSVAVSDLKATKEVNFTVQQSSDGKLSVSVEPFQF